MTKENADLKCEMLRQKQPIISSVENDCGDFKQPVRPVSMYETREGLKSNVPRNIQVNKLCVIKTFL